MHCPTSLPTDNSWRKTKKTGEAGKDDQRSSFIAEMREEYYNLNIGVDTLQRRQLGRPASQSWSPSRSSSSPDTGVSPRRHLSHRPNLEQVPHRAAAPCQDRGRQRWHSWPSWPSCSPSRHTVCLQTWTLSAWCGIPRLRRRPSSNTSGQNSGVLRGGRRNVHWEPVGQPASEPP